MFWNTAGTNSPVVVGAATASNEAVNLGQAQSSFAAFGIQSRCAVFTTNNTWTVPAGITEILVSGCAGGAGGNNWCSGAAGQPVELLSVAVTPGHSLAITIGAAGAGGYPNSTAGGNTVLVDSTTATTLLTLTGGGAAIGSTYSAGYPNGSLYAAGGYAGGVGASGPFGAGGPAAGTNAGQPPTALAAYGYGAGGGQQNGGTPGGNGAPGILILKW